MPFELTQEVEVHRDTDGYVTQLSHVERPYSSQEAGISNPTRAEVAEQYVRDVTAIYGIDEEETTSLREALPPGPVTETVKLRRVEEKNIIDTTAVITFQQTADGLPIWNANLSVLVTGELPAVVSSSSTLHQLDVISIARLTGFAQTAPTSLFEAIGVANSAGDGFVLNGVRLLVYRYDPAERIDPEARPTEAEALPLRKRAATAFRLASSAQADAGYDPANPRRPGFETPPPMQAGDADAGVAPEGPSPSLSPAVGESFQQDRRRCRCRLSPPQ